MAIFSADLWSNCQKSVMWIIGERALEGGNFSVIQKKENIRINNELRKILG